MPCLLFASCQLATDRCRMLTSLEECGPLDRSLSPQLYGPRPIPSKRRQRGPLRWYRDAAAYALRKAFRLANSGEFQRAFTLLSLLARAVPDVPWIHLKLAFLCERAGADPLLARRAVSLAMCGSRLTAGVFSRALAFEVRCGNTKRAEEIVALALASFPSSWRVWQFLGVLHLERGEPDLAIRCFSRQVELAASVKVRLKALNNVARCNEECGNKEEAVRVYQTIIATAAPGSSESALAYSALVHAASVEGVLDVTVKIRELLGEGELDEEARQYLHYAVGTSCDRRRQSAEAFAHFHLANEIRGKKCAPIEVTRLHEAVKARMMLFDRATVANLAAHGCRDHSPICIVGMPRSGTTLIEQIVSSHSAVYALGERFDIVRLTQSLRWQLRSKKPYPLCIEAFSPGDIQRLARSIACQRSEVAAGSPRVTTKAPDDLWDLGLISILFPRAKFIHCCRHPIDTCLSCYMQNFEEVPYATSLTQLAEVYHLYQRMMTHWRSVLPISSIWEVSYETLLEDPEHAVRDLLSFCGLDFEEGCLQFYRNPRRVQTTSLWDVRKPLYTTSVSRWERYRVFLGPLLELAQYSTHSKECNGRSASEIGVRA
jgi:tetratricopeptide (TPR) repeat protein